MESATDLYPPTMPNHDSLQIFDTEMSAAISDEDLFFDQALIADSPDALFGAEPISTSSFASPIPIKSPTQNTNVMATKTEMALSASPESSMHDSSSSDASSRPERKVSSRSSNNGLHPESKSMADARLNSWKNTGAMAQNTQSLNPPGLVPDQLQEVDFDVRHLENELFDFDSAASSPSPNLVSSTLAQVAPRHIAIPFRDSPRAAPTILNRGRSLTNNRGRSPTITLMGTQYPPQMLGQEISRSQGPDEYADASMAVNMQQVSWSPHQGFPMQNRFSGGLQIANVQQSPFVGMPTRPQIFSGSMSSIPTLSHLSIHPTPHKSRVETQIPIKMTLHPMPEGATKLHLPPHTISKPKLLCKTPYSKSPETLELYTSLVCTSAMQDPAKRRAAFERAARATHEPSSAEERRRASSEDPAPVMNEEDLPQNGGEVYICDGCIVRERKRAARKKSKKPEEEEPWQEDEARRIIVFNTAEVKEWQAPSHTGAKPIGPDGSMDPHGRPYEANFPDGAMQIDIPMRIACYCRHQGEKLGFQVIFTIKDWEDTLIAQSMSNPIVITDDHKTHAPPNGLGIPGAIPGDFAHMAGNAMFGAPPIEAFGTGLYRNAHSSTDLSANMQPIYNASPFLQQGATPFAMPLQSCSQPGSVAHTPRNLSRAASPTGLGGQMHKRRKPSGNVRLPDNLTMTRIQTTPGTSVVQPGQSWASTGVSVPTSPTISPFTQAFGAAKAGHERNVSMNAAPRGNGPVFNGPPTPNSSDPALFHAHSFDTTNAHHLFSTPTSTRPSRAPSPAVGAQTAAVVSAIATPTSAYGLNSRKPTIHKLIPCEGTKAGGIEITCLGSGFLPGLEIMFGDALATTTTFWGETSLVCLLPPAVCAGTVPVIFKHQYAQALAASRYPSPTIPKYQVFFKYVDEDEQELLRQALLLVHQKMTGMVEDAGDIARRIVNSSNKGQGPWAGTSNLQTGEQQRQASALYAGLSSMDLETNVLKCLDVIDCDGSPYQAHLDMTNVSGQSILHVASSLGFDRLVAGLLARGASPNVQDRNGMTPMHMAALSGQTKIVHRLRTAGAVPYMKSFLGYSPVDMVTTRDVYTAVRAVQPSSEIRRLARRASSIASFRSHSEPLSAMTEQDWSSDDEDLDELLPVRGRTRTPQHWAASRPHSLVPSVVLEDASSTDAISPMALAMTAWRDNLAAQIQHFQHSVHWALPNLQVPALPPMPAVPGDHESIVRRFSSLVTGTAVSRSSEPVETSSVEPPAYDEIYPTMPDSLVEQKRVTTFDALPTGTEAFPHAATTVLSDSPPEKRIYSDRNLFFIWIPLLVIIILATITNQMPHAWEAVRTVYAALQDRYQLPTVRVGM